VASKAQHLDSVGQVLHPDKKEPWQDAGATGNNDTDLKIGPYTEGTIPTRSGKVLSCPYGESGAATISFSVGARVPIRATD
jgi:hypothetical protein